MSISKSLRERRNKLDAIEEGSVNPKRAPAPAPAPKPAPKAKPKQGLIERTRATMKALDKERTYQRENERKLTAGKTTRNDPYLRMKKRAEKEKASYSKRGKK